MGDRRKCQTYTASPAEPGGLPVMLVDAVESRGVKYRLAAAHPDTQTLNAALAEYDRWTALV